MYDVVIGRSRDKVEKHGVEGSIFIGKQYVEMGAIRSLSNNVYLDVSSAHVVFICGKRGGGKSYTMGVLAEGMANLPMQFRENLSVILLDTMGIYWTMKYPNNQDAELLKEWGINPKELNPKIYVPQGFYNKFKQEGIPVDYAFSVRPSDFTSDEWCTTFEIDNNSPGGVLIERIINQLQGNEKFTLNDMIEKAQKDNKADDHTKNLIVSFFEKAQGWGLFSADGTPIKDLAVGGQTTVLDVSAYTTLSSGWEIKNLVVGLVAKKLFNERMIARKKEEFAIVDTSMHYFKKELKEKLDEPLVWLILDEAHEMLPREGMTAASQPLITILREGRQPGISVVLATQQPGKIHTDVMTQSDIVLSHRLTAQIDVQALEKITQSYMADSIGVKLDMLPKIKGSAIVFDDMNEKVFPLQIRPRITWHGGSSPSLLLKKPKMFF